MSETAKHVLDHTGQLLASAHNQTAEQIKTFVESVGATVTNTVTDHNTTKMYIVIKHQDSQ